MYQVGGLMGQDWALTSLEGKSGDIDFKSAAEEDGQLLASRGPSRDASRNVSRGNTSRIGTGRSEGKPRKLPTPQRLRIAVKQKTEDESDLVLPLSPSESGKFFGSVARAKFFDRYQWLYQQHSITNTKNTAPLRSLYYQNEVDDNEDDENSSMQSGLSRVSVPSLKKSLKQNVMTINSSRAGNRPVLPRITTATAATESSMEGTSGADDDVSEALSDEHDEPLILAHHGSDSEDDIDDDLSQRSQMIADGVDFSSPVSPRSTYISSCIREGLNPRAALILRKKVTKRLKLQHMGIGDKMGKIFSESIAGLPFLESINIADNGFTDAALEPILKAIANISSLRELDMSNNVIGRKAAAAMDAYLRNPACSITRLALVHADVDDFEAERFVGAFKINRTVTDLDLTNNKLGAAENLNTVMPDLITGGEALADLLRSPQCILKSLRLGWNMLRYDGGIDLCSSIAANSTLTYLDLSYNAIGHAGGIALGKAIQENRTLETLNIASNGIDGVACFTICVGVIENGALRNFNVDGNPIGDHGARCLMLIPAIVGTRIKVSARNCNITIKDPSCTFDFGQLCRDYRFSMDIPYERAMAMLLLHMVASHHTFLIPNFEYEAPGSGRSEQVNLTQIWCNSDRRHFDDQQLHIESSLLRLVAACENVESATNFFNSIDQDGSGEIDRDEFRDLADELGIELDESRLDEIFDTFDTDQGGTIGKTEFLVFLKRHLGESKGRLRDLTMFPAFGTSAASASRYIPPATGKVKMTVFDGFKRKRIYRTITSIDRRNIDDIARMTGEKVTLTTFGVSGSKIRFDEAYAIYAEMAKESRDRVKILSGLLPQLENCSDARLLVAKALNNDKMETLALRKKLGSAIKPMLGNFNCFYVLDMTRPLDRFCLIRLLEISKTQEFVRAKESKIGMSRTPDLSQKGNRNSAFRNEHFNGKPILLGPDFAHKLPNFGTLTFDFSAASKPLKHEMIATDPRIVKTLVNCFLLPQSEVDKAFSKLNRYTAMAHHAMRGDGWTIYEPDWDRACAIGDAQVYFEEKLPGREAEFDVADENDDISVTYERVTLTTELQERITRSVVGDIDLNSDFGYCPGSLLDPRGAFIGVIEEEAQSEEVIERQRAREEAERGNAAKQASQMHFNQRKEVIEFMTRFASMLASPEVRPAAKASRIVELLEDTFTRMWILAKHLALMVELFKHTGSIKNTESFGTFRVELCVLLYERVVDVHNMDLVLRLLEPEEVACLYCRLGWLQLFNPMKPEGSYNLNLSRFEERIVAKCLCYLATNEPGDNWPQKEFHWHRDEPPVPGWELTVMWMKEDTMPANGHLYVTYSSGDGKKRRGCAPYVNLRKAMLQLTYIKEEEVVPEEDRCSSWESAGEVSLDESDFIGQDDDSGPPLPGIQCMQTSPAVWHDYFVPLTRPKTATGLELPTTA